jgi:putative NADPH-quinone reductase
MGKRIVLIQGHPDPKRGHFVQALAEAYESAALSAAHEVRRIDIARLDFPVLRSAKEWAAGPPAAIRKAQESIAWADHLVVLFPLWLGDMPALLKAFFEQTLRPGFAIGEAQKGRFPKQLLKGRSARVVVTMGMPAFFYKLYYRAHSVKSLKRNILEFCGVAPVRTSYIGMVEATVEARADWLTKMAALGVGGD